jgi:hypothetical protein
VEKKKGRKQFSITFQLIEIERKIFAPKLLCFWPTSRNCFIIKTKQTYLKYVQKRQNPGAVQIQDILEISVKSFQIFCMWLSYSMQISRKTKFDSGYFKGVLA